MILSRFAATVLALLASPVAGADQLADLGTMRTIDGRLAAIAYRLTTANAPLCRDLVPQTGMLLQALDQFAPADRIVARRAFVFASPVSVEAVVPGSAADRAGVRPDDGLLAVNGVAIPGLGDGARSTSKTRDAALAMVAARPATAALRLSLLRAGREQDVVVQPIAGCPANVEALYGKGNDALSDGATIQVAAPLVQRYPDEQVAVIAAHELAHSILRHRIRLEAAGVRWGLLAELGRNARLFRLTEVQADRLSVYLLRNAGYPPEAAVTFWRTHGGDIDGGLFRSRTHPSSSDRARVIAEEIAQMRRGGAAAERAILDERDVPLR